jgi:ribonuclease BN (tRNA processing enzyme)
LQPSFFSPKFGDFIKKQQGAAAMFYKILGSGSKGNCVKINDVLIDCGLPFKKIKEELYDVKYLLLTHIHSDHIKPDTLLAIIENFPHIKIISNYEVYERFPICIIANAGFPVVTDDYVFHPFEALHDVVCYGYTWTDAEGNEIIYCTDTGSMENAPVGPYDYLFLESNHDEKKLEQARLHGNKGGYDPFLSGKRHLSTQECKAFFYMNRRSRESELIELHKSSRFY